MRLRTFFIDLFVLQEFPAFFHSILVLLYYLLLEYYCLESLEKQIWQNDQTQYRASKFFEGILQACQKFYGNSFPEHHFVVRFMTTQGILSGWHRLTSTGPIISFVADSLFFLL